MVRRRRSLFVLALAAAFASGCALIVGIKDHDFQVASEPEAGGDAEPDQPDVGPPTCSHIGPPGAPSDGGTTALSIVFAVRTFDFTGATPANVPVGFDLDGVCTCDPTDGTPLEGGPTCTPPSQPLVPGACDAPGGIDNALRGLYKDFMSLPQAPVFGDLVNQSVACGRQTLLLALSGYNGEADDPDIAIATIFSRGIRDEHDGGTYVDADCGSPKPYPTKWDGQDLWSVPDGSVDRLTGQNNPNPPYLKGWVRNWQLVIDHRRTISGPTVQLLFGDRTVETSQPIIVARIVRELVDGGPGVRFSLADGVISGRTSATSVISAVGSFRTQIGLDGGADTYLCDPKMAVPYQLFKSAGCSARDVTLDPDASPDHACDALSLAVQFTAETAVFGSDWDPPVSEAGVCGPGWIDTCK